LISRRTHGWVEQKGTIDTISPSSSSACRSLAFEGNEKHHRVYLYLFFFLPSRRGGGCLVVCVVSISERRFRVYPSLFPFCSDESAKRLVCLSCLPLLTARRPPLFLLLGRQSVAKKHPHTRSTHTHTLTKAGTNPSLVVIIISTFYPVFVIIYPFSTLKKIGAGRLFSCC
jgi:hypothetical protein